MPQKTEYEDKFVLICEEAEICKRLSSNDIKVRKKGVAALKHLLKNIDNRKVVDSADFSRLWNGIFNFIWMSDKLLVQEEDVESISKLIHVLKKHEMLFVREFFNALTNQWNRISHYRTDKFLMMIRRFLRQILFLLKNSSWDSQKIESFGQELFTAVQNLPLGLILHLNDIYIEEIAKVCEGDIPTDALILLLKGYVECIVAMKPSMNVVNNINSNIFSGLTRQLKLHIKQKAVLDAEESDQEVPNFSEVRNELPGDRAFDPRPGNVDVFLPFIEFDEKKIVEFFLEYESRPGLPAKVRNILSQMIGMFNSITKLRESVKNPKKVMSEAYNNTKKRKKRHKSFGAIVKKSCKRLEMFEAEYDNLAEDRILKKLEKMNDLIQIPVGRKLVTVEKKDLVASNKKKKLTKKEDRTKSQTWMVTENVIESAATSSTHNIEWTVSESVVKTDGSSSQTDNSQNLELVLTSPAVKENSCSSPSSSKRRSSDIKYDPSSPTKSDGFEISDVKLTEVKPKRKKVVSEKCESEITPVESVKVALSPPQKNVNSPKKSPKSNTNETQRETVLQSETWSCKTPSPKKSPKAPSTGIQGETTVESSDASPNNKIHVVEKSPKETENKNTNAMILDSRTWPRCTTPSPKKSPKVAGKECRSETTPRSSASPSSKTGNTKKSSKVARISSLKKISSENMTSPSRRTRSRVSCGLEDGIAVDSPKKKSKNSSKSLLSAVIPLSAVNNPPTLSPVEEHSASVSPNKSISAKVSRKKSNDSEVLSKCEDKRQILTSDSPAWITVPKDELVSWLPKDGDDDNDDMDYDLSGLFTSPPQQMAAKKRRRSSRPVVHEVKRSARLANKAAAAKLGDDKKVAFTRNNSFQEVREYRSTIRSSPQNPYDGSKTPVKGILKPFAVPGPINPFYFPNGQPKLLNLRNQRLSRFL